MNNERLVRRALASPEKLSVADKEAIAERLGFSRDPKVVPFLARGLIAAAAAITLALAFMLTRAPTDDFGARGDGPLQATIAGRCAGPCTDGAVLMIDVQAPADRPFTAVQLEWPGGDVEWVTPRSDADPSTRLGPGVVTLPMGVKLTRAGRLTVRAYFTRAPALRQDLGEAMIREQAVTIGER